ncbi:ABC transporter substrate-binding protein [Jiangella asiatica]|uniref:Extracellular solute-binding protein n=1 Tax=Jiangella asiatica TaxID=2530372 RepID=A0A4R5CYQ6_9ACTN|nr:extracellular solute-binding protein [Jiangella asiatica]TDE03105.1 extracellular solute-binding protein [Jiangella asiatica]
MSISRTSRLLRLSAIVAAATLVAASCGSDEPSTGDPGDQVLSVPSHLWEGGADAEYMALMEELTVADNPGASIDKPVIPFADYHQQAYTQMVSGQAPDVVIPYDPQMTQWVQQDLLEPLNPWLEEAGVDVEAMIEAEQVAVVDGEVYGLLAHSNPRLLVFNRQLFEQAGVEIPTTPEDWRAAIEAIRDTDNEVFGAAFVTGGASPADIYQYLMPIVAGFGGAFVTDGEPTATSDEVVEALDFVKGLYNDGLVPAGTSSADIVDAFQSGKIASVVTGPFLAVATQEANPEVAQHVSLAQAPLPNPSVSVNLFMAMPRDAQHKDLAADFILNTVDPQILDLTIREKFVPPGMPVDVPADLLAEHPYLQEVVDAATTAVSYAPGGVGEQATDVMNIVGDGFQAMLTNDLSAEETAESIQNELTTLLGS